MGIYWWLSLFRYCLNYQQKCGSCPQLKSKFEYDLSRFIWNKKNNYWKDINLTIVTPSNWLANLARKSSLLKNRRIEVIPNGLDLNIFKPINKKLV